VLLVEEFSSRRNSVGGFAMLRLIDDLNTFYEAVCGDAGTFAWMAAQSFGLAIMDAMRRTAMESPEALAYLQTRCRKQGQLLYRQLTVEYVLPGATPVHRGKGGAGVRDRMNSSCTTSPARTSIDLGGVHAAVRTSSDMNNIRLHSRSSLDESVFSLRRTHPVYIDGSKDDLYNNADVDSKASSLSPGGMSPTILDDTPLSFMERLKF